jgi:hypothetical protein
MAKRQVDLLQGTLDLLVLKSLALGPLHGLGVSNRIAQITNGTFNVKPGSLFPALHRMSHFCVTFLLTAFTIESKFARELSVVCHDATCVEVFDLSKPFI